MKLWIAVIAMLVGFFAISYGITCGLLYLACLCFGAQFNILYATGIWICLIILSSAISPKKG